MPQAWKILGTASQSSNPNNAATTAAFDTTGADLIVVSIANANSAGQATLTDSAGNSWTALTRQGNVTSNGAVQLFYCENPTTSATHTFTAGAQVTFGMCIQVIAVENSLGSGAFDAENGSTTNGAPGNVTPAEDGELYVSASMNATSTADIVAVTNCAGQTIAGSILVSGGNHFSLSTAIGYAAYGAGIAGSMSHNNTGNPASVIASFKAAASAAGGGAFAYASA